MSERLALHDVYVLVLMEFMRFGLPCVRLDLADQCAYEVCKALGANDTFRDLVPEVYAWRSSVTEDGRYWYYPECDRGIECGNTDTRHVGGVQFDQRGVRISTFRVLLAIETISDSPALEMFVMRTIRPYILDEAELRVSYEREVRDAVRQVDARYKAIVQDKFNMNKTVAGATA